MATTIQPIGPLIALSAGLLFAWNPAAAQKHEIVVESSVARFEIERILEADNLDIANMSRLSVAQSMRGIPKGSVPDDFWASYQAHVRAWQRLADATGNYRTSQPELLAAEQAVNSTFDDVELIARRYGARMPKSDE